MDLDQLNKISNEMDQAQYSPYSPFWVVVTIIGLWCVLICILSIFGRIYHSFVEAAYDLIPPLTNVEENDGNMTVMSESGTQEIRKSIASVMFNPRKDEVLFLSNTDDQLNTST